MPASHPFSAATLPGPSVLLLEEYDALAAAIGSALKKFAPQHVTTVARSLTQAEKFAAETGPELLVLDVDPPWPGLTDFLQRMRAAHPNTRALVIGGPIPAEIAAERRSFGALQFIEKPFELAAFGAAVQALLGPWRESESASQRGTLRNLNAIDIVLVHCAANANVIVEVSSGAKDFGEIHIAAGEISHAETRKLTGAEALRKILSWPDARMSEGSGSASPRRTSQRVLLDVVLETLRAGEARVPTVLPAEEVPPATLRPKAGKKIVIIDDTEMLLIFAEDVLATADPELEITTALSAAHGLKQVERIVPDLVLLDYSLPDFNGDELCERLLQNERTAHVPVLMMSGHVLEMNAAAARLENVVAIIEKPFLSDALVDLVQETLRKKKSRPKIAEAVRAEEIPIATVSVEPRLEPTTKETASGLARVQVAVPGENEAVLGVFLEVVSMQLTPQLQMGAIRAKPASMIVSLHLPSAAARNAIPAEIGFQLGATELDRNGRISTMRLVPTARPFQPSQTRSAFEIGGVSVIPNHARTRVQLTPAGTTPMTMELLAHLELAAVELSPTFQVAQLILKWRTQVVRVTLNPKAPEQSAARFEATSVKLDGSGRIAELLLNPIK